MKQIKLNWFEKETIRCLMPYEYDDTLSAATNHKIEYLHSL